MKSTKMITCGTIMALCLTATPTLATWDRDDTSVLWNHLKQLNADNPSRTTLDAGTYYVRGQIMSIMGHDDLAGSGSQTGRYYLKAPASGALKIIGAPGVNGSTALTALTTRIVHGVVVGDEDNIRSESAREVKTWSQLETNDPWRLRFPESVRADVRWIEFPNGGGGDGFIASDEAHDFEKYAPGRRENWPTVTYFGAPLRYAEAMVGRDQDFPDYRWTRTDGGTQTLWEQVVDGPYGASERPPLWFLGNCDWTNDYTWGITFHSWDANCGMARVASLTQMTGSLVGPVGGPFTQEFDSRVQFTHNPFTAATGGSATLPNSKQRFTLINAPEFLNLPGTMVFNPDNGRIYFIKPTGANDPHTYSNIPVATELNMWMEVSWPQTPDNANNFSAPFIIGDKSVQWTMPVEIKNIAFGTGRGAAIIVTGVSGTSPSQMAVIDRCLFRNQGTHSVQLNRCKYFKVTNSHFLEGYRGHLYVDAWRNFTMPYGTDPKQENPFPIDDVRNLTNDYIRVNHCTFEKGGLMWPYNGALEMRGWNIGTRVEHNVFTDLSGIAVRIHGAQNIVENNEFYDCVKDVTDYGAIYVGRSLVQLGSIINFNTIQGVKWRGRGTQERVEGSMEDDVCGIYCDDYICGTQVTFNTLIDCQSGIESNGGRFNLFRRNYFDTSVDYPFRTNVMRNLHGDSQTTGSFSFYDDVTESFYKHSLANQLYTEMRNLYMACKTVNGTYNAAYNVFADSTAWQTAQTSGAYDTEYTSVNASSRKDLEHLAARLNDSATGQPTWDKPFSESLPYKDSGKNSLRRIQYANAGDWFVSATNTQVSNTGNRVWITEYAPESDKNHGAVTALRNYGNMFRWNECDFADPLKNPALNTTTSNPFFTSYRPWWSWKDHNYMVGDDYGYEATEVPCEAWE